MGETSQKLIIGRIRLDIQTRFPLKQLSNSLFVFSHKNIQNPYLLLLSLLR